LTAATLIGGWMMLAKAPGEADATRVTQFTLPLPEGMFLDSAPVVSPDSRHIAFVGTNATGSRLFVRALDSREAVGIPGTEGSKQPFWAPDSKAIGYFARQKLMRVAWPGGAPVVIADAPEARGGTWSPSGDIVFAPDVILAGLSHVPAGGGTPAPATLLEVSKGDNSHWWPHYLPDKTQIRLTILRSRLTSSA
jgi:hypothetical protein